MDEGEDEEEGETATGKEGGGKIRSQLKCHCHKCECWGCLSRKVADACSSLCREHRCPQLLIVLHYLWVRWADLVSQMACWLVLQMTFRFGEHQQFHSTHSRSSNRDTFHLLNECHDWMVG